jgi:hypothetical protein
MNEGQETGSKSNTPVQYDVRRDSIIGRATETHELRPHDAPRIRKHLITLSRSVSIAVFIGRPTTLGGLNLGNPPEAELPSPRPLPGHTVTADARRMAANSFFATPQA